MPSLPVLGRGLPASFAGFFIPFAFSLFVVAVLGSKAFLLAQYAPFIGPLSFVVFLPTYFTQDVIVICLARFLLMRHTSKIVSFIQGAVGMFYS